MARPPTRLSQFWYMEPWRRFGTLAWLTVPFKKRRKTAGIGDRARARQPFHRAGRHDGRRQVVGRPPAGRPARHSLRRCRYRDRKRRRHDHSGNLRQARRGLFPRRRSARDRAAVGQRPAGAGDRRRLDHGPGNPRPDPHQRHLGLAEGRSRRADEAHQAAQRPPAGGKDQGPAAAARAGLCAVRHRRAVARRAARHHRRRNHRQAAKAARHRGARGGASHDRAAAPCRADRGAGRAGRARLRHRHRPRADRERSASASRRCGRAPRPRSSPTPPWPSTISPPPRPR